MSARARRWPVVVAAAAGFAVGFALLATRADPEVGIPLADAAAAAAADPAVAVWLKRGWDRYRAGPLFDDEARVSFFDGGRLVVEAAVAPDGRVTRSTEYITGNRVGAPLARNPILVAFTTAVFALMLLTRPLRSLKTLDVAALAVFAAGVILVNARFVEMAHGVWFGALLYLGVRMIALGLRGQQGAAEPLIAVPRRMLVWAAAGAAAALGLVALTSTNITDVAYASVAGATHVLEGDLPYGAPTDIVHSDTYPLLAYLLFVPAALLTPVQDSFDEPTGALVLATAVAFLVAWGIYRTVSVRAGGSAALRAVVAWFVFAPTLVAVSGGTNDVLVAVALVAALAAVGRPALSALLVALAVGVKVGPLVALPAWLARSRGRALARALAAVAAVGALTLAALVLLGGGSGPGDMLGAIRFQEERRSLRSPWTMFAIEWLQPLYAGAALAVATATAAWVWFERPRLDVVQLAALAAGTVLLIQLAANYWAVTYLIWVVPLILVVLVIPSGRTRTA